MAIAWDILRITATVVPLLWVLSALAPSLLGLLVTEGRAHRSGSLNEKRRLAGPPKKSDRKAIAELSRDSVSHFVALHGFGQNA